MRTLFTDKWQRKLLFHLLIVAGLTGFLPAGFAQSSYSWQGALIRELNPENFWVYPCSALGADGKTYLMYRYRNGEDIRFETWNGTTWSPLTSITRAELPGCKGISDYQDIAVDGNNNIHVVIKATNLNDTHGLYYGFYNGSGWSFEYFDSYPLLFNSKYYVNRPIIEVDAANNPYIGYVVNYTAPSPAQTTMKCAFKKDGAWTISNIETIIADKGDEFDIYDFTVSPSGVPHAVYTDEYNNDYIFDIRHEYYNGSSWVSTTIASNMSSSGFLVRTDADSNPYIVMSESTGDYLNYWLKLYKNTAGSWSNETLMYSEMMDYWVYDMGFNSKNELNILYSSFDWFTWESSAVTALQKENGTWKSFVSAMPTDWALFSEGAYTFDGNKNIVIAYTNDLSKRPRTLSYLSGTYSAGVTLPTAPSAPDLAASSDAGSGNTDNITNDDTPTFTGTSQPSKTIKLYANGTLAGSATADGSGNWSVTASALAAGDYSITAKASDVNGESAAGSALSITIDTQSPTVTILSGASDPTNASPVPVKITFSEPVTGFDISDLVVTGGTASNFSGIENVYGVEVTPSSDGTITISIAGGMAYDIAGNANTAATPLSLVSDRTAPSVALSASLADPSNASAMTVTVTFSEKVTDFTIDDLAVAGGTKSNFSGGGTTYTADITPASDGTVTVDVKAGVTTDAAGNGNLAASRLSRTFDRTGPAVSMTGTATDPTNQDVITVSITFSEPVIGFEINDVIVSGGTKSNFAGSGDSYSVDITPSINGTVTVDIAGDVATDDVGNGNSAASRFSVVSDKVKPSLMLSASVSGTTSVNSFTLFIAFSESVTGFDREDIIVTNAGMTDFTGSGGKYAVEILPAADGPVTVNIPAAVANDAAGNDNESAELFSIVSDRTSPAVVLSTEAADPVNGPFSVTFTFSEAVSGFTQSGITGSNALVSGFTAVSETEYKALITPVADGKVTVQVAGDAASDNATNGNEASLLLALQYDHTQPALAITSDSPYAINNGFTATFTFSEAVTGFDAGDIVIVNGAGSSFMTVSALMYTVFITPAGDGEVKVSAEAGAASDMAGNSSEVSNMLVQLYDATLPEVMISAPATDPVNAAFKVTFTFSEDVTGFDAAGVVIDNGAGSFFTATSAQHYTMMVTPASNGAVGVSVAAGAAVDVASNSNEASGILKRMYDATPPALTLSSEAGTLVNSAFTVVFTFSEEVTGFDVNDISVSNGTAGDLQSSDNLQYNATITPATDGPVAVHVEAGAATDAATNASTAGNAFDLTYDGTKPAGYAIATGISVVDVTNVTGFSFTVSGAETGTHYFYTISGHNGGIPVEGDGTVHDHTFNIDGLDLTNVHDGDLTVAFHLLDKAGNKGPDVTLQVKK